MPSSDLITNNGRLRASPSVRVSETQDGAVLLDVKHGLCFSVNPIGVLIWKRVSDCCELEQIAQDIASTFKVSVEQARTDTQEFVDSLIEKHLLLGVEPTHIRRSRLLETVAWLTNLVRSKHTNR